MKWWQWCCNSSCIAFLSKKFPLTFQKSSIRNLFLFPQYFSILANHFTSPECILFAISVKICQTCGICKTCQTNTRLLSWRISAWIWGFKVVRSTAYYDVPVSGLGFAGFGGVVTWFVRNFFLFPWKMQKGGLKTNWFLGLLKISSCWTGCYSSKTLIPFLWQKIIWS